MTTTLDELIREMNDMAKPVKITLAWELLPALDGTLHAVDPEPTPHFSDDFAISLCRRALKVRDAVVLDSGMCPVCKAISRERQAEFDGTAA